jgi:hypothetical protein
MEAETDFSSSRQDPLTITNFNQDEALQHPKSQELVIFSHIQNVSKYFATGLLAKLTCVKSQDFL